MPLCKRINLYYYSSDNYKFPFLKFQHSSTTGKPSGFLTSGKVANNHSLLCFPRVYSLSY